MLQSLRLAVAASAFLQASGPLHAVVGNPTAAADDVARSVVMIVSTRASLCTGTAIGPDLVLTAAHCVAPTATYRVFVPGMTPPGIPVRTIAVHPGFSPKHYAAGRASADVALLKLEKPLPDKITALPLATDVRVKPDDRLVIAGYGVTALGSSKDAGAARTAELAVTGKPGELQIRLHDPIARGETPGLGACTGDSGGPALIGRNGAFAIIGIVSWSTGARGRQGCGGLTGVTPLKLRLEWVAKTASEMGNTVRLQTGRI